MRDFLHVDDTCQAVDLLLHAPAEKVVGEVFNVASGKHKSILEIAHEIARRMNFPAGKIVRIGDRLGQVFRHTGSTSKIAKVVGWDQKISWDEGLNRTIEWFRRHRSIWEKQIPMRHILIRTASGKKELH
jgi:dTDP-glucose 4,6-dehydratase